MPLKTHSGPGSGHTCQREVDRKSNGRGRGHKRRSGKPPTPGAMPQSAFTGGVRGAGLCSGSSHTPKLTSEGWSRGASDRQ